MRWWDIESVLVVEQQLFGAESWSVAMFWSELAEHETRDYFVARDDGQVVGYGGLSGYGDEAYVQTLAVATDHQGAGIGTALLRMLLGRAAERGAGSVFLEVRADNFSAQQLYARHGFMAIGLRRAYYQPSGVDAVVMRRD